MTSRERGQKTLEEFGYCIMASDVEQSLGTCGEMIFCGEGSGTVVVVGVSSREELLEHALFVGARVRPDILAKPFFYRVVAE